MFQGNDRQIYCRLYLTTKNGIQIFQINDRQIYFRPYLTTTKNGIQVFQKYVKQLSPIFWTAFSHSVQTDKPVMLEGESSVSVRSSPATPPLLGKCPFTCTFKKFKKPFQYDYRRISELLSLAECIRNSHWTWSSTTGNRFLLAFYNVTLKAHSKTKRLNHSVVVGLVVKSRME